MKLSGHQDWQEDWVLKIAQVAPLYESVPPTAYGGTERVVSWITEELVKQGHEVTLFASGDSITNARLVSPIAKALRLDSSSVDSMAPHILAIEQVARMADQFDIIHYHLDYLHFPTSRLRKCNQVTTLHGRLNIPELKPLYREFREMAVVSISDNQRNSLPYANWVGTVYHGMPKNLLTFVEKPKDYLLFLGRIAPEKGTVEAIEIAIRAGREIKIAAKVDSADRDYFNREVRPLLRDPLVDFVGEVTLPVKNELLGGAKALIFPINWPEPFGLVMIEAMACGTPTIAFNRGSVPEVLEDGRTGYIVENIDEAVSSLGKIDDFDRGSCREIFEQRYSVEKMVAGYLEVYENTIRSSSQSKNQIISI